MAAFNEPDEAVLADRMSRLDITGRGAEAGSGSLHHRQQNNHDKRESSESEDETWNPPSKREPNLEGRESTGQDGKDRKNKMTSGESTSSFGMQENNNQSRTAVKQWRIKIDSKDHKIFLEELNFKDYFMEKNKSRMVDFKYTDTGSEFYLESCCSSEDKNKIEEEMNLFLSSIKSQTLPLDSKVLELLFTEEGSSFLKDELKKRESFGHWRRANSGTVRIFAHPSSMEKVSRAIEECFIQGEVSVHQLGYFYFTTPTFQRLKERIGDKTLKVERKLGLISFAAIKPIADEIFSEVEKYRNPQCFNDSTFTPIQIKAIKLWGKKLEPLQEKKMAFLNEIHSEGKYLDIDTKLLDKPKVKKYVDAMFKESKVHALYDAESSSCLNIIACNRDEAKRAEKILRDALKTRRFCNTDELKKILQSELFKKMEKKYWEGKYLYEGLYTEDEVILLATNDIIEALSDFLNDKNPTEWEEKYKRSLKKAVETELVMNHEKTDFNEKQLERKFHCTVLRKTLEPQLANCWILKNEKDPQNSPYFRVHHIAGHAESLNVDVVMCPCSSFLWPLNECFLQCVKEDLQKTDERHEVGSVVERLAPDGFGCQKIMYLIMCEPNSCKKLDILKSVIIDALMKADKSSYASLAIPLLPEELMSIKTQAKEISRAISHFVKFTKLENVEEIFLCECSGKLTEEIQNQLNKMLCSLEGYIDFKALHQSAVEMETLQANKSSNSGKISIDITKGSLVSQEVEVLVNTCRRDLDLSQGAISSSILNKGGKVIQEDIQKKYPNGIKFAEVAVSRVGTLNCRHIFHSALFLWTPHGNFSLKVLKLMIWNCLAKADELRCKTIAFPSLGTGNLGYPYQLVAETIYHTIECYEECNKDTNITDVQLVLFEDVCIQQFQATERRRKHSQLFQSREEKHPSEFLTSSFQSVLVDLLPSMSEWRWGCLLKISFTVGKENNRGPVWDDSVDCWRLLIDPPSTSLMSNLSATVKSFLHSNPLEEILKNRRISSVELTLEQHIPCSIEAQMHHFLWMLENVQEHFIQHVLIVFPNKETLKSFSENQKPDVKLGPLKNGRRKFLAPIMYEISGNAQDVSQAKQELRSILTKNEEKKTVKNYKTCNSSLHEQGLNMSQGNSVKDLDSQNEIPVFESISGTICSNLPLEQITDHAKKNSCKIGESQSSRFTVTTRDLHFLLQLNKDLKQAAQALNSTVNQKDKHIPSEGAISKTYPLVIKMSECEFQSFMYFGEKDELPQYKKVSKSLEYKDGALQASCPNDESFVAALKKHYDKIRTLNTDFYAVPEAEKSRIIATVGEIQKEFPEAFFYVEESKINITCNDYAQLQLLKNNLRIKLEGGQTNRRNRRFQSNEDANENNEEKPEDVLKKSGRRNRRFESNETASDVSSSTLSGDALEVKIKDDFIVKVYQGSITKLRVDCIVNAANDQLMHGGGVAYAIAEAAGYEFSRESAEYIRQNGPIPVGKCCVTSAGKLHYKCVIHTVGPRWHDYNNDEKKYCFDDLQEAVEVTFREAERLKMTSVAIPAISSGIFGVPKDKCVECYYQAVVAFLSSNKPFYLKEIHFVDRDQTMVDDIKAIFAQSMNYSPKKEDTPNPSYTTLSKQKQENLDVSKSSSIYRPPSNGSKDCVVFEIPNSFSVHLFTGNIVNTEAEAVVCPQDKNCNSKGRVAHALMGAINDNTAYPPKKEKECRFGDVFVAECKSNSARWKYILHTVAPKWDRESAKTNQQYMKSLEKTYRSIFEAAEREQISSIVMPILGAGVGGGYDTPLETCSKMFATAVKSFSDENDSLKSIQDIKLVFQSKAERYAYTDALKEVLDSDDFEVINLPKERSHIEQISSTEEHTCCICMDTPSNPKALKCGHVFCRDCIDQQFKYKPACPSCGKVFGKMTGDQPPGTVTLRKERRRLPGYEDCGECIVITYSIRGGLQGEEHPNPDKYFKGITRSGYLPNNTKGRQVAKLLNIAFSRKLMFTIGRSRTTGEEGVVTWNDIHHKTRPEGGPQRFGYPDDTYLDRVLEELAVKGVTPESADDPEEYNEYSRCFY